MRSDAQGADAVCAAVEAALVDLAPIRAAGEQILGAVLVFRSRRADRIKILLWDGSGLVMFYKHDFDPRLLQGTVADGPGLIADGIPFAGLEFYRNWLMPSRDILTPDRIAPALLQTHTFGQGRVVIADYNEQRPHQGRWCYGKTPMQTLIAALPLAKEKLMAA